MPEDCAGISPDVPASASIKHVRCLWEKKD